MIVLLVFLPLLVAIGVDSGHHLIQIDVAGATGIYLSLETCAVQVADEHELVVGVRGVDDFVFPDFLKATGGFICGLFLLEFGHWGFKYPCADGR